MASVGGGRPLEEWKLVDPRARRRTEPRHPLGADGALEAIDRLGVTRDEELVAQLVELAVADAALHDERGLGETSDAGHAEILVGAGPRPRYPPSPVRRISSAVSRPRSWTRWRSESASSRVGRAGG
jgi:hypothetical protein